MRNKRKKKKKDLLLYIDSGEFFGIKKKETLKNGVEYVPNIKALPKNIAHLCKKGDMVYCVPGNGACGPNSISAHLFKDEVFGPKLRQKINDFKL